MKMVIPRLVRALYLQIYQLIIVSFQQGRLTESLKETVFSADEEKQREQRDKKKCQESKEIFVFNNLFQYKDYLEVVFKMDTNSLLNPFYRKVCRWGLPEKMLLDHGGNYMKANQELRELVNQFKNQAFNIK